MFRKSQLLFHIFLLTLQWTLFATRPLGMKNCFQNETNLALLSERRLAKNVYAGLCQGNKGDENIEELLDFVLVSNNETLRNVIGQGGD